jgi:pimeloyl-ACP methyl ester carboxylesterase
MVAMSRMPPPSWQGTVTRARIASTAAPFTGVPAKAPFRSTRCSHSQPGGLERRGLRGGVVAEHGGGLHLAAQKPDALAVLQVDGGIQDHGRATLECVDAFGTTDFRPDLPAITVPTLILHGTADKTVPIEATAREAARLIAGATLIEYDGGAHGITATHADQLLVDMLDFLNR